MLELMLPRSALHWLLLALVLLICGCSGSESQQPTHVNGATTGDQVLNLYNWADYIEPSVIDAFEHEYGIKVHYDVFSSSEMLETKLLTGHSNYESVEDLDAAEQTLKAIRPYVRYLDSRRYIEDLASGETCLALGWSMDVTRSRDRAIAAVHAPSDSRVDPGEDGHVTREVTRPGPARNRPGVV